MNLNVSHKKIAFGDFQTPDHLADLVCKRLKRHFVTPKTIIEPTCGVGNFINLAVNEFLSAKKIFGYEISNKYISEAQDRFQNYKNVSIVETDFFNTDWANEFQDKEESILILGNLPWVTSSTQGALQEKNLPRKYNFLNLKGLDAVTGKSNFDISEWMLITLCEALKNKQSEIAVLVKTSVARKILLYLNKNLFKVNESALYEIDSKKYFNASVSACLFYVKLNFMLPFANEYKVFCSLESELPSYITYTDGNIVNGKYQPPIDGSCFISEQKWRSGVKHDAAKVMEFKIVDGRLLNGYGESVNIESEYLYPLMKGSDIANGRLEEAKMVLVTQRNVGEDTSIIKMKAPLTWHYLESHASKLNARKSIIYKNNPFFSVFGVGTYAFKPWKIAICSLYKHLSFKLIGPIRGKPCFFDDTVYYISFYNKNDAEKVLSELTSSRTTKILNSLIFWDDKRPIKTSILNKINFNAVCSPKQLLL